MRRRLLLVALALCAGARQPGAQALSYPPARRDSVVDVYHGTWVADPAPPDLFAVALPSAGHYDMLRYHRFTIGAGWIPEYGSPDDSTEFRYLYAYSPLHHVLAGTCHPATLILAAEQDRTVVPSHSYKFVAALQAAQACERPILLRMAGDASHGYASAASAIAERSDVWAFVAARMGVPVPDRR